AHERRLDLERERVEVLTATRGEADGSERPPQVARGRRQRGDVPGDDLDPAGVRSLDEGRDPGEGLDVAGPPVARSLEVERVHAVLREQPDDLSRMPPGPVVVDGDPGAEAAIGAERA